MEVCIGLAMISIALMGLMLAVAIVVALCGGPNLFPKGIQ